MSESSFPLHPSGSADVTLADVLKKVKDDLAWRGPTGRVLGNIVLPRAYAECLDRVVRMVLKERDELVYERENRK